jgi:hypothetical protein
MDLKVPYSDKEEAKQLGARWSPERRCWYVPEGISTLPFSRWWKTTEKTFDLDIRAGEAYLVAAPEHCWRCNAPITVIGFLLAPGFEVQDSWESSPEEVVGYWTRYDDWGFAHYIRALSPAIARIATSHSPTYRQAYSKAVECRYWANHCPSCRARQGDFSLFREPGGAFMPTTKYEARRSRAEALGPRFEATGDFSLDIDMATAIPGVGDLSHPIPTPVERVARPVVPQPPPKPQSFWSRLASRFRN